MAVPSPPGGTRVIIQWKERLHFPLDKFDQMDGSDEFSTKIEKGTKVEKRNGP